MNSPSSPAGRGQPHAAPAEACSTWPLSADTRQNAQEADASMAREGECEYAPTSFTSPALPAAKSKYFLP
ncbi:hypothetical protein [Hymenobacter arizonensis]|uniref:hypothetical protein n=1 Tax=Hymenobacter arizonensis TaxID=1227077 RepID=UPI0015A66A0F|nr:hypothetical protein [Hymenobacter arizonensis]